MSASYKANKKQRRLVNPIAAVEKHIGNQDIAIAEKILAPLHKRLRREDDFYPSSTIHLRLKETRGKLTDYSAGNVKRGITSGRRSKQTRLG